MAGMENKMPRIMEKYLPKFMEKYLPVTHEKSTSFSNSLFLRIHLYLQYLHFHNNEQVSF